MKLKEAFVTLGLLFILLHASAQECMVVPSSGSKFNFKNLNAISLVRDSIDRDTSGIVSILFVKSFNKSSRAEAYFLRFNPYDSTVNGYSFDEEGIFTTAHGSSIQIETIDDLVPPYYGVSGIKYLLSQPNTDDEKDFGTALIVSNKKQEARIEFDSVNSDCRVCIRDVQQYPLLAEVISLIEKLFPNLK